MKKIRRVLKKGLKTRLKYDLYKIQRDLYKIL